MRVTFTSRHRVTVSSSGGARGATAPLTLVAGAATNPAINVKINAGDANPTLTIRGDGMLQFGPGGASAVDGSISRGTVPDLGLTGINVAGPGGAGDYGLGVLGRSCLKQSGNSFPTLTVEASGPIGTGGNIQSQYAVGVSTAGSGLRVAEGSNAKQGVSAAMAAGAVTVANTSVTASSRISVTRQPGGTNPGAHYVSAIVAGTSFTITSTNAADTGTSFYEIFEPG